MMAEGELSKSACDVFMRGVCEMSQRICEHEIRATTMPAGLYWWCRDKDETGMSGTGRVAQVAIFKDGCACLRWLKDINSAGVCSTVSYDAIGDLLWVHGHGLAQTGHLEPILGSVKDMCDLSAAFRLDIERMKEEHAEQVKEIVDAKRPPFWSESRAIRQTEQTLGCVRERAEQAEAKIASLRDKLARHHHRDHDGRAHVCDLCSGKAAG